jgi:hypothetical protein
VADFYLHRIGGLPPIGTSTHAIDASDDAIEFVFQQPVDATLTRAYHLQGTATGTPPTYQIGITSPTTAGRADYAAILASTTFTPTSGTNNTGRWLDFAASYAATRGQFLVGFIRYSSGTVNGSNYCTFGAGAGTPSQYPQNITVAAGTGTKVASLPNFAVGSSSVAYGSPLVSQYTDTLVNGGLESGMVFTNPTTWCSTYTVLGADGAFRINSSGSLRMRLYQDTTVLQEVTIDTDALTLGGTVYPRFYFDETTLSTLSAGSTYRLAFSITDSTDVRVYGGVVSAAADWDAWPGGQAFAGTSRSGSGAWTDVTTRRPSFDLIVSDWTLPASGGLLRSPGMGGGISG